MTRSLMSSCLALALFLVVSPTAAAQEDRTRQPAQRLDRLAAKPELSAENLFLHEQAVSLLERGRKAPAGSFLAGRMELAVHDLLDASERILESRDKHEADDKSEETRRLMSRDLERTYFRIQEGDYFSRQTPDAAGSQYVVVARHVYQIARAAYDDKDYGRVRLLSEAARGIIGGLEKLAQAARGVPDPPRIPEE